LLQSLSNINVPVTKDRNWKKLPLLKTSSFVFFETHVGLGFEFLKPMWVWGLSF
jgi:hypothetical protein